MAKQLNINMSIDADVSKAKKALNSLQQTISKLGSNALNHDNTFGYEELEKAKKSANDLNIALTKAFNKDTGKFDLSRFQASLKYAKNDIASVANDLTRIGPEGTQAFLNVARAIQNLETPAIRMNKLFGDFFTTLKNTAKWQISSNIIHGFEGALKSAYGYAQDLNESLNNIRIVSGNSADQMAEFAAKANQAAQALSTTTTAYTDAALIFYQQGRHNLLVGRRV